MANQSTFREIFKICPKSTKFTSSSGVKKEKFIKVEPPFGKNKVKENKHSCEKKLVAGPEERMKNTFRCRGKAAATQRDPWIRMAQFLSWG